MQKLLTILSGKQPHFHHVSTSAYVSDALSKMSCQNLDYLVVIDENENFAGVLTEHDITTKVLFNNAPLHQIIVKDIMSNQLPYASGQDTIEGCMQLMQQHHVRFVPVFDEFIFVGIISSEDLLAEAVYKRTAIFDA